jgi:NhaA family Na+:H+ antiporter
LFEEDHKGDSLNAFEHFFKDPVEIILFAFGLANAGVTFSSVGVGTWLVTYGLLFGKPAGIFLLTVVGIYIFKLSLPEGMNYRDLLVAGVMAGIGFTVALFVTTVAFDPGASQDAAKMGALFSFGAAALSVVFAKSLCVGRYTYEKKEIPLMIY